MLEPASSARSSCNGATSGVIRSTNAMAIGRINIATSVRAATRGELGISVP